MIVYFGLVLGSNIVQHTSKYVVEKSQQQLNRKLNEKQHGFKGIPQP